MAGKVQIGLILLLLLQVSCKKSEDRSCWKGHGETATREIPITDSVFIWHLHKDVKYRIFQDSLNKIVVNGGENMINLLEVQQEGGDLTIENNNKCHFLRNGGRSLEVEIHYPDYHEFMIEPSDSVVFEGTISSDTLIIQLAFGGGSMVLDANTNYLSVVVSRGTADYLVSGQTGHARIKVQDRGYGDATGLTSNSIFAYLNSTADLYVNLEGANAIVQIDGTGDIYAKGTPSQLIHYNSGSGEFLQY